MSDPEYDSEELDSEEETEAISTQSNISFYQKHKKRIWIGLGIALLIIIVIIVVSVMSNKTTNTPVSDPIPVPGNGGSGNSGTGNNGSNNTGTPDPTPIPVPDPTPDPTPVPPAKKLSGELCSADSECVDDNICKGNICLPKNDVSVINNLAYYMKFKNIDTGKYLCAKPGPATVMVYSSDGSNKNECTWRTKMNKDGKLQIIRNLSNLSIGPILTTSTTYSADTWPADTKWNYIDDSKVLKNNYYSTDYPAGVQSNIDNVTGGCMVDSAGTIKTGSTRCASTTLNNKWQPEFVQSINCVYDRECNSGKCVNNLCLSSNNEWCNVDTSCASGICMNSKCTVNSAPIINTNILKDGSIITLKSQLYDIYLNYCDNLENDSCKGYLTRVGNFDYYRSYWTIKKVTDNGKSEINYGEPIYLYQFITGKTDKHYLSTCGSTSKPVSGYWVVSSPRTDLSTKWKIQSSVGESGVIKSLSNVFLQNSYDWNTRLGMFSGGTGSGSEWCDGWNALTSLNFNNRDETKWTVALIS